MEAQKIYHIEVKGVITKTLYEWFEDVELTEHHGNTILTSIVPDQSYLYGLIGRIRDLGLTLISIHISK